MEIGRGRQSPRPILPLVGGGFHKLRRRAVYQTNFFAAFFFLAFFFAAFFFGFFFAAFFFFATFFFAFFLATFFFATFLFAVFFFATFFFAFFLAFFFAGKSLAPLSACRGCNPLGTTCARVRPLRRSMLMMAEPPLWPRPLGIHAAYQRAYAIPRLTFHTVCVSFF